MDQSTEMAEEDGVDVFGTIALMAAHERDMVGNSQPGVKVVDNISHQSAAWVGEDACVQTKCTVVAEKDCCNGKGRVVANGVGLWKLCI